MINKILLLFTAVFSLGCSSGIPAIKNNPIGAIAGCVIDLSTLQQIADANAYIPNSTFGTRSDEKGKYVIANLPAGYYTVAVSHISFHTAILLRVRVAVDSVTVVNLRTYRRAIPEEPVTVEWTELPNDIQPIDRYPQVPCTLK